MRRVLLLSLLAFACSCAQVNNISYFQDVEDGATATVSEPQIITLQADDKISIVVNSKDMMLMQLVNLPVAETRVSGITNTSNTDVSCYTVDKNGEIDFPVLGKVHIAGMSREQVASTIKERLISEEVVKDPVVTVEFANLTVSVIGEVSKPGQYSINKDKITLLDALSMAGDLTIYGVRDNITLLRESEGVQTTYKINLLDRQNLLQSPAYYLTQNDIIYVEPNDVRSRQSTVNGNNIRSTSFWISLASLLTTITILFVN